jgi:hypothetical protein
VPQNIVSRFSTAEIDSHTFNHYLGVQNRRRSYGTLGEEQKVPCKNYQVAVIQNFELATRKSKLIKFLKCYV